MTFLILNNNECYSYNQQPNKQNCNEIFRDNIVKKQSKIVNKLFNSFIYKLSLIFCFYFFFEILFPTERNEKNHGVMVNAQEIDHSIWNLAQSTNNIVRKISLDSFYEENANCQLTTSYCKVSPNKPKPREGHTSIHFKTYNITDASRMCLPNYCGPYCTTKSSPPGNNECFVNNSTGDDIPTLESNAVLEGLLTSNDTNCPSSCCSTDNELCLRTYDVSGRKVELNQEILIIFGGIAMNEVLYEDISIADDCELFSPLLSQPLFPKNKLNQIFLINSCGIQLLNEIWFYEIATDTWYYTKPHIDDVDEQDTQAIPQARAFHTAVYIEQLDYNLQEDKRIKRKYMYVYGGYSIYCQNACEDFWKFEIAYGPQRYYPMTNSYSDWNRGNRWTQIYSASTSTPGKRLKHSMVVLDDYSEIILFGGIEVKTSESTTYTIKNDLWGYDISGNKWSYKISMGVKKQTRSVSIYFNYYFRYYIGMVLIVPLPSNQKFYNHQTV